MFGFFFLEFERIVIIVIEMNFYFIGVILMFKKSINFVVIGIIVGIDVGGIVSGE